MQQVHWGYKFYLEAIVYLLKRQKSSNTQKRPIFNFFFNFACVYNLVPQHNCGTQIEAV